MNPKSTRGTWGNRVLIRLSTFILAILFYWLLGFILGDIEDIKGPSYSDIEQRYIDAAVVEKKENVEKQIADLEKTIDDKSEQQQLVGDSSKNLQRTINQLLELQKLSIQKSVAFSDSEKNNLATSLKQFLESQKNYQEINRTLAELTSQKLALREEVDRLDHCLAEQRKPADIEYEKQWESHRLRLAVYQLAVLVPLAIVAAFLLLWRRGSIYYPLFLAMGGAVLLKVAIVVHEYFPTRYFKYILILVLLAIVLRWLLHLIWRIAFPKVEWLRKQYREAYERFMCPVCDYPIRTGPRRFLYWTRRTVHKVLPPPESQVEEEPYVCPSCGAALFETCPACQKVRHVLMPFCEHCGAEQDHLEDRRE